METKGVWLGGPFPTDCNSKEAYKLGLQYLFVLLFFLSHLLFYKINEANPRSKINVFKQANKISAFESPQKNLQQQDVYFKLYNTNQMKSVRIRIHKSMNLKFATNIHIIINM